jgi:[CysO sulfur-carrier protein]-S-L-cysteine hydrolase
LDLINSVENMQFRLTRQQYEEMLAYISGLAMEEACGLIGGKQGRALKIYPIANSLHSPTRFRMDAVEQVEALMEIERNGWELMGIYHSHLQGPGKPSQTDTAEYFYPGVSYLIFNLLDNSHNLRGFQMVDGDWIEIPIVITD